jgi:hypothetical protein
VLKILRQLELIFPTAGASAAKGSSAPSRRSRGKRSGPSSAVPLPSESCVGNDTSLALSNSVGVQQPRVKKSINASDDFLLTVWRNLRQEFFPEHVDVDDYVVTWSSRPQKRVLASCNIRRRRIVVAQELFEPAASRWISAVLYHEMCHAVIGEGVHLSQSGKRQWHGRQFRQLEAKHPDIEAMNAWIATGGWAMAVRSHRARQAWRMRVR